MPIFLLTPLDLAASDWAMSTHRQPVQVEAENEQEARSRAALRFRLIRRAEDSIGAFAWHMPKLVAARVVDTVDKRIPFIERD